MSLTARCPSCHILLRVPDGTEGKSARCPKCQESFVVRYEEYGRVATPAHAESPRQQLDTAEQLQAAGRQDPLRQSIIPPPLPTISTRRVPKSLRPVLVVAAIGIGLVVMLRISGFLFSKVKFGQSTEIPPQQLVEDAVRARLPAFLSLDSTVLEGIPTGPQSVRVNFKASVIPKEDLHIVDRVSEMVGAPRVTLLKVVQSAGTESSIYGSVEAKRFMDQWSLDSAEVQGLDQFGSPRGEFKGLCYVVGTPDADQALRNQAATAEASRKAVEKEQRDLAEQVKERVQDGTLPSFLSVETVLLEPIPTRREEATLNFKVIVTCKEELTQQERVSEMEGATPLILVKVVQRAGDRASLSGSVVAHRGGDRWTLERAQIDGIDQVGRPRPAGSYVMGTDEAERALKSQAQEAADFRERKRQEEIACAERIKKEEAEKRRALLDAVAPGRRYVGTMKTKKNRISPLRLVFTGGDNFTTTAEATDPNKKERKVEFSGVIRFEAQKEDDYQVVMNPTVKPGDERIAISCGLLEGFWVSAWDGSGLFGGGDNALKLRLTDEGLEGIALGDSQDLSSGPGLTISLRPEGAKQPGGEGKPKPKIEGKVRKGTDNPFGQQKSEKSGPQELKPE